MSRRRRSRRSTASSSSGAAIALAAVSVMGVMGVTVFAKQAEVQRTAPAPVSELRAPLRAPPTAARPPASRPRELSAMQRLDKTVREAEHRMPSLRKATRGGNFESLRVELLSEVSGARDELATYLDAHPSDDRANRLWDRVLRAYVALKKL